MPFIFYINMDNYNCNLNEWRDKPRPTARQYFYDKAAAEGRKFSRTQKATRQQRKRKAVLTARILGDNVKNYNRFFVKKTGGISRRDFCYVSCLPF